MLELIGTAAPASGGQPSTTATGLDSRVKAGLDFAQMLRQAEQQQAPLPKARAAVSEPPRRDDAPTEAAVAQDDAREENVAERVEDEAVEDLSTAKDSSAGIVAVAVEVDIAPVLENEAEGDGDEEGDTESFITSVPVAKAEGDEEAPLEADIDGEGDEDAVAFMAVPVVENDTGNAMELLNFNELMDPDLVVEKAPDQLIARINQAAGSAAVSMQEELAETVMPQVIRSLATLVREGGAEMRLQLAPADLGEIELRVRTTEGVVRGEMMVQHPEVKQLLEDQVDRLKSALAAQGLALEGFDVNVDRDPRFAQTSQQGNQSGQQRNTGLAGDAGTEREVPVAVSIGDHEVDFTT